MNIHLTPARAKSRRRQAKREEKRWARQSGKVSVRYLPCPICGEPHDRREPCPTQEHEA